jgi:DNA-binding NarL/FixJ family response regulator
MPGTSGADLIARLKAYGANFPILILSMHNEPEVAARALRAGASGYITKDCEPEILLAAIRKVSAGGRYIAPELAEQIAFDSTSVEPAPLHNLLSGRELQVFRLLTTGKSVNDIAELLVISNKTVSTHKVRLMEKMNLSNVADLTRYAIQHKLLA